MDELSSEVRNVDEDGRGIRGIYQDSIEWWCLIDNYRTHETLAVDNNPR